MMTHLGKKLSVKQCAALLYALSEGAVGPGANAYFRMVRGRVHAPTVTYLVGAGLLTRQGMTDGWAVLTPWGREVAVKVKVEHNEVHVR